MPAETTKWYASKTLWFASKVLWANAGLAAATVILEGVPDSYVWVPLANMILRYFTSRPLG